MHLSFSKTSGAAPVDPGSPPLPLLFLCLARNCEATLPHFFSFLDALTKAGLVCQALIGENGSTDGTRPMIEGAKDRGITLIDTSSMTSEASRLLRMARGRQILLDAAKLLPRHATYICVADLDNVMNMPPTPEAMRASVSLLAGDHSLFAVGASSYPVFYDLLALRAKDHDYSDLDAQISRARKKPLSYFQFHQEQIYENQRRVTRAIPMRCLSSFNGLCLYNAQDYFQGDYLSDSSAFTCEHVTLNESITRSTGKEMLISAQLQIQAPQNHTPVNFARFWMHRLQRART